MGKIREKQEDSNEEQQENLPKRVVVGGKGVKVNRENSDIYTGGRS